MTARRIWCSMKALEISSPNYENKPEGKILPALKLVLDVVMMLVFERIIKLYNGGNQ